jgi:hypothetical protein
MRPWIILLLLTSTSVPPAFAGQQICWELGRAEMAEFIDTWQPGQPRNFKQTLPTSNCPATGSYEYTNESGQRICVTYTQPVTRANQGYSGTCTNLTGFITNITTYECFKYDACVAATSGINGMCQDVRAAAYASWLSPTALDCNLMTATWKDLYLVPWVLTQGAEKMSPAGVTVTGTVNTDLDPNTGLRCGTWLVAGRIYGNGWTELRVTNPRYPGPKSNCVPYFDYAGTTSPDGSYGNWNDGVDGDVYAMSRVGNPPGVTGTRTTVAQSTPSPSRPPWADTTAPPPPPPPPPIFTPFNNAENGKWSDGTWIYLEWAPMLATSFDLYRSQNGGPYTPVRGGIRTLSYKDTGLVAGQRYCYQLYAHNDTGVSGGSTVVCRVTLAHPQAFGIVSATGAPGQISLTWGHSANAGGYNVYTAPSEHGPWRQVLSNLSASTLSATVTGLTDGIGQAFKVRGVNGNSDFADTPPVWLQSPCGRRKCQPL